MIEPDDADLLVDLARLVRKFGPDRCEALAGKLRSPEFIEAVAGLLSCVASLSRVKAVDRGVSRAADRGPKRQDALEQVRDSEPEKYELLTRFTRDFKTRNILPTLRDVRSAMVGGGVRNIEIKSREQGMRQLVTRLAQLSLPELKERLGTFARADASSRDLDRWANIILKRGPPTESG